MGARIDVRIDSDRDRRFNPVGSGNMADSFKFGFRFNVETMNPCREGLLDFPDGFAQTRKNDLARVPACCNDPLQFAAGDYVKPSAQPRQNVQHCQVGIGFYCETYQSRDSGQRFLIGTQVTLERCPGIDEARSPVGLGKSCY